MSFSIIRLSLESETHNQLLGTSSIRHHPNGLVTFSSSSNGFGQPIYANTRNQPIIPIKPIMNNRNNSDYKSNHLQQMCEDYTTPRFMNNSSTLEV